MELGYPEQREFRDPYDPAWLEHWDNICFYVDDMDSTHSPYASAQRVIRLAIGDPSLWDACRGAKLDRLLRQWDGLSSRKKARSSVEDEIRETLRSITEDEIRRAGG